MSTIKLAIKLGFTNISEIQISRGDWPWLKSGFFTCRRFVCANGSYLQCLSTSFQQFVFQMTDGGRSYIHSPIGLIVWLVERLTCGLLHNIIRQSSGPWSRRNDCKCTHNSILDDGQTVQKILSCIEHARLYFTPIFFSVLITLIRNKYVGLQLKLTLQCA